MFIAQQTPSLGRFFHDKCAATLRHVASCIHLLGHVQSSARMHSASMLAVEKKGVMVSHAKASLLDMSQPGHCLWSMLRRTTGVVNIFIVLTLHGCLVFQYVCALFWDFGIVPCAAAAHDICSVVDFSTQMIALPWSPNFVLRGREQVSGGIL